MNGPIILLAETSWSMVAGLIVLGLIGLLVLVGFVLVLYYKAFYKKVDQGHALIVNTMKAKPLVTFTGCSVIPVIHRAEVMDISVKTIEVDRRGANGLICRDKIRADVQVAFYVRVNKTEDDVLTVASAVGVNRASDKRTLEELFMAKFSEALKTVGMKMDFEELYNERQRFKEAIIEVIGKDLNGYALEDTAIDYLEQTPLNSLDPQNVFDAVGIEKITALTEERREATNGIRQETRKKIEKQDTEAAEAIFALQRQRAEAEAVQKREIGVVQARETAEIEKVQFEEKKRSEEARIVADQDLGIQRQNAAREVEIAQKNRERAVAVEQERVEKERQLEVINRERATDLSRIEKEKAIEIERKAIADVVRERVAVDKTVAQEEERIKDLRATMTADRNKTVKLTEAAALAEEEKIRHVVKAEAESVAAGHEAKERLTLAEAEQAVAEKKAIAEIRLAEAQQAKSAAEGLAAARVKEADAVATEKHGLALVKVQQAEVTVIESRGKAEAVATQAKMGAEAQGIAEKAESMKLLNDSTRGHEEFRLRLEKEFEIARERINAQIAIAEKNAGMLAEALKNARFDIVGGDGAFFDRFVKAISFGKSLDAAVDRSDSLQLAAKEYIDGERSLPQDLTQVLSNPKIGAGDLKDLAAASLLSKLGKDPKKAAALLDKAKELGFGDELAGWLSGGKQG